jgi:hypothetical protein
MVVDKNHKYFWKKCSSINFDQNFENLPNKIFFVRNSLEEKARVIFSSNICYHVSDPIGKEEHNNNGSTCVGILANFRLGWMYLRATLGLQSLSKGAYP